MIFWWKPFWNWFTAFILRLDFLKYRHCFLSHCLICFFQIIQIKDDLTNALKELKPLIGSKVEFFTWFPKKKWTLLLDRVFLKRRILWHCIHGYIFWNLLSCDLDLSFCKNPLQLWPCIRISPETRQR